MATDRTNRYDVLIVGGGVIGLACAWRAARRGLSACVLERDQAGSGATGVAAGMLAPVGEASWGEESLLELNLASHRRWPEFASELEDESGLPSGYAACGALHVALDRDEAEELRRRHQLHRRLELDSEWLPPSRCRQLEPGLAPAVAGGLHAPHEAAADPGPLSEAMIRAFENRGGRVEQGAEVAEAGLSSDGSTLTTTDGREFHAGAVVLAAGAWSGEAPWLPSARRPPIRPVKGQILTLRGPAEQPLSSRIVAGERFYVVPRDDGRVLVGATVEERGFETTITAGGIHELLRESYRALPDVAELELVSARAGLRPGTPDNAPLIGRAKDAGLIVATGHYRNGVLLAPITADAVADLLVGEEPAVDLGPFDPGRFAAQGVGVPA